MAYGGNKEGLFWHAAMGDSPSLGSFPLSDGPYATSICQQFAHFAYVVFHRLEAPHFLTLK